MRRVKKSVRHTNGQAVKSHLSFCKVIGQAVEEFVKHLKPWKVTVVKWIKDDVIQTAAWHCNDFRRTQRYLSMQRQVLEVLVRRQKPNLWLPLRSVKTKVKCCTATPSFALCGQMQSESERRTQTKQTNEQKDLQDNPASSDSPLDFIREAKPG